MCYNFATFVLYLDVITLIYRENRLTSSETSLSARIAAFKLLFLLWKIYFHCLFPYWKIRRGARVVEEARLESVYTPKGYHEFESRSLRFFVCC